MTKRIVLFGTVLLFSLATFHTAQAQQLSIGPWVGVNLADLGGDDVNETDMRTGFAAGGFLSVPLGGTFSLVPGAYYSQQGTKTPGGDVTLKLDYIQLEALLSLNIPTPGKVAPFLFAGPALGINASCKVSNGSSVDCEDEPETGAVKSTDFSLVFGGGLGFRLGTGTLFVTGGYSLGLTDIPDEGEASVKNRVLSFGLGWGFPLGGAVGSVM